MNTLHRLLTIAILAICVASHAGEFIWRKNGKPIADTGSQKARAGFGAMLLLIDDKKFFEDWKKPTPPRFTTITNATRMVPIYATVIFAGAGRKADGETHVTCDVTIRKPDGSVYGEQKELIATQSREAQPSSALQLAQNNLAVHIEPHDPTGTYIVEVIVRDKVKKVDLRLKERFTVSK